MARRMSGRDARVWALHMRGVSLSSICAATGLPEQRVRSVVTGVWLDDKMAAGNGR